MNFIYYDIIGIIDLESIKEKEAETIEITTFPVDLDLLFWNDNLSMQTYYLNMLGNGSDEAWLLTPWGGHFISNHIEGVDHWYCFTYDRPLEVRIPHNGTLYSWGFWENTTSYVNGTEVLLDTYLTIDIGHKYFIKLGHLCMLKNLSDYLETYGEYFFEENELVGYTRTNSEPETDAPQLDFWLLYDIEQPNIFEVSICPFNYLSSELQSKVSFLYSLQYERMKIAGVYPESKLCNPTNADINNTVWGTWRYFYGPFNTSFDDDIFYEFEMITNLHQSFWNKETFYKDPRDVSRNLSSDVIGYFTDAAGTKVQNYTKIGESLVKLKEGNFTNGILEMIVTRSYHLGWGFNKTIYCRFDVFCNTTLAADDILTIEYFENLTDAQAGFTDANLTYRRYYDYIEEMGNDDNGDDNEIPSNESIPGFLISFVLLGTFLVIESFRFIRNIIKKPSKLLRYLLDNIIEI